jgi:hypothetical protein
MKTMSMKMSRTPAWVFPLLVLSSQSAQGGVELYALVSERLRSFPIWPTLRGERVYRAGNGCFMG